MNHLMSKIKYDIVNCIYTSDESYCKFMFKRHIGKELNLNNPETFNEKLQWLKLNWRDDLATKCADKYEVRKYIQNKGLSDILNDLIGVYENADDIDFKVLPDKFVLKATHGSGWNIICKNKKDLDIRKVKKNLKQWLKSNYYQYGREWVYQNIPPRIVCEKFLEGNENGELIDYKFMCFNGEPKICFICLDRYNGDGLKVDFYDMNWNRMPFYRHYKASNHYTAKPDCFDEMVKISKALSADFPFVRVDLYLSGNSIYFGELTFYPGNGLEEFHPEKYDYLFGSWLDLSGIQKIGVKQS